MRLRTAGNLLNKVNEICYKKFNKIDFLNHHKVWAISSKTGEIQLATATYSSRTVMDFKSIKIITLHESSITEIVEIDEPMCIGTGSMDGTIKLYSTYLDKCYTF